MFSGIWFDTAIGVALFFLAMSFVVSAAVEGLAQLVALRAKTLQSGIESLLRSVTDEDGSKNILAKVYGHSLVKGLADNRGLPWIYRIGTGDIPSYMPSRVFATALLDIVTRNGPKTDLAEKHAAFAAAIERSSSTEELTNAHAELLTSFRQASAELDPAIDRQRQSLTKDLADLGLRHAAATRLGNTALVAELDALRVTVQVDQKYFTDTVLPAIAALRVELTSADTALAGLDLTAGLATALPPLDATIGRLIASLAAATSGIDRSLNAADQLIERIDIPELRDALRALLGDGRKSVDELRQTVAKWFDDSMDRVSGWYKRRVNFISFLLGLLIAVAINADAINVTTTIAHNETLRGELVGIAQSTVKESSEKRAATLRDALDKLPIGWYRLKCVVIEPQLPNAPKPEDKECVLGKKDAKENTSVGQRVWKSSSVNAALPDLARDDVYLDWGPLSLLGWLITALAVKLGAPFWFDLLSTLVKMRASGKPAETPKVGGSVSIAAST